jgi:hypothetical protein
MISRVLYRLLAVVSLLPVSALLVGTLLPRAAHAPPATPSQRRQPDLLNDVCIYRLPGMADARVRKDIPFAPADGGAMLKLDLYLPPQPTQSPPPVVVLVNGVGAVNGHSLGECAAYARTGDAGFMPGLTYCNAACSYARVGQKERASELLAKAVQTGMIQDRSSFRRDRDLESLFGDPRFEALIVGPNATGEPGSLL